MHALRGCDRATLEASFARGLDSLWMAYQPIVRACDGAVFGFEALVRTGEPTLAQATEVLHAAELLERLVELGRAVRACVAGRALAAAAEVELFVNVDTCELFDGTLTSPDGPLAPIASRVVLEITERASVEHLDGIGRRIAELRERGYRIALDDLGSGYAGLTSLAIVEPDVVKLDQSLVRDVHASPSQQKLVRALVDISHDLGCLVVGEGVETVAERDTVAALGCDLLQGFLLGRPDDAPCALGASPR